MMLEAKCNVVRYQTSATKHWLHSPTNMNVYGPILPSVLHFSHLNENKSSWEKCNFTSVRTCCYTTYFCFWKFCLHCCCTFHILPLVMQSCQNRESAQASFIVAVATEAEAAITWKLPHACN